MRRFEGKVALVTGAASGIGKATAVRLAQEGARVMCGDVNEAGMSETVAAIGEIGGVAESRRLDVSKPEAAPAAVAATVERFGALHALCNVAGIGGFEHTAEVTLERWSEVIAINLSGTFYMCQAALPQLLECRGAIVNVASSAGLIGQAYCAAYCASKGGVVQLTKALAVEFARQGLRVNCVCPGGVITPLAMAFRPPRGADMELIARLSLVQEMCDPSEIANAVAYLASDEARYVNGAVLSVDGGMVAS